MIEPILGCGSIPVAKNHYMWCQERLRCAVDLPSLLAPSHGPRKRIGHNLQVYASSITAVEFLGGKILAYLIIAP